MGTDIHVAVQIKDKSGKWSLCAYPQWDEEPRDPSWVGVDHGDAGDYWTNLDPPESLPKIDNERHYDAFARLAGVRNTNGVEPISEPRGIPEGFYAQVDEAGFDRDGVGDHSWSHLTAAEILSADWNYPIQRSGLVSPHYYRLWKSSGSQDPESWCLWIYSGNVHIIDERLYSADTPDRDDEHRSVYVRCSWESRINDPGCVEMATEWADRFGAENVRFVFGFDS